MKALTRLIKIFILPALILFLHIILGKLFNAYTLFPWIDIPMHFFGGITIGISYPLLLNYFTEKKYLEVRNQLMLFILIISLVALTIVIWEFLEFSSDYLFRTIMQPGLQDTIADLFLGLTGGIVGYLISEFIQ
ncbi:hypothetical protein J4440_00760 [Candidatus Woesearchaeota archaeon]|nr:hypothetical protein [Candidatus Woesearchaeota archaeon]